MRHVILGVLLISSCGAFSQRHAFVANSRIFPSSITQTEPVIAVHPTDPQLMFASAYTINTGTGATSEGVYVTTNGGTTWFGSDVCTGQLISNHGGSPGVVISRGGRLILTHKGVSFPGMYSHFSTNLGTAWSSAFTLSSTLTDDKGMTTTLDADSSSPFYGRVYAAWVNAVRPYPVLVSSSSNEGQSWTAPVTTNSPPPTRSAGGYIRTGLGGKIYVCWAGVTDLFPYTEDYAGLAASTNGGVDWTVSQSIFDMNGINGTLAAKGNIRVNGLPHLAIDRSTGSRRGWLYIVTTERDLAPAGSDPDVILRRSTNDGVTWSAGIRVNRDPVSNGKIQYLPAIDVDARGGINIIFYDDRNTSSDSAEVMLARSTDGGNTWTESVISDHRFKPKPILGAGSNYQGDHISVISVGDRLFALWMDDSAGLYQVWLASIDVNSNSVEIGEKRHPLSAALHQNYPNPFNPATSIEFTVMHRDAVSLKVFDVLGREVTTLFEGTRDAGRYEVRFEAPASLPSGVYLYRLHGSDFSSTKAMVLLK